MITSVLSSRYLLTIYLNQSPDPVILNSLSFHWLFNIYAGDIVFCHPKLPIFNKYFCTNRTAWNTLKT